MIICLTLGYDYLLKYSKCMKIIIDNLYKERIFNGVNPNTSIPFTNVFGTTFKYAY